jgi:hypothetical protein
MDLFEGGYTSCHQRKGQGRHSYIQRSMISEAFKDSDGENITLLIFYGANYVIRHGGSVHAARIYRCCVRFYGPF